MGRSASSKGGGDDDGEAWFEVGGESLVKASGQGAGLLCAKALILDIPVPKYDVTVVDSFGGVGN